MHRARPTWAIVGDLFRRSASSQQASILQQQQQHTACTLYPAHHHICSTQVQAAAGHCHWQPQLLHYQRCVHSAAGLCQSPWGEQHLWPSRIALTCRTPNLSVAAAAGMGGSLQTHTHHQLQQQQHLTRHYASSADDPAKRRLLSAHQRRQRAQEAEEKRATAAAAAAAGVTTPVAAGEHAPPPPAASSTALTPLETPPSGLQVCTMLVGSTVKHPMSIDMLQRVSRPLMSAIQSVASVCRACRSSERCRPCCCDAGYVLLPLQAVCLSCSSRQWTPVCMSGFRVQTAYATCS